MDKRPETVASFFCVVFAEERPDADRKAVLDEVQQIVESCASPGRDSLGLALVMTSFVEPYRIQHYLYTPGIDHSTFRDELPDRIMEKRKAIIDACATDETRGISIYQYEFVIQKVYYVAGADTPDRFDTQESYVYEFDPDMIAIRPSDETDDPNHFAGPIQTIELIRQEISDTPAAETP